MDFFVTRYKFLENYEKRINQQNSIFFGAISENLEYDMFSNGVFAVKQKNRRVCLLYVISLLHLNWRWVVNFSAGVV